MNEKFCFIPAKRKVLEVSESEITKSQWMLVAQRKIQSTYKIVIFSKTAVITTKWLKSPGQVAQMREY